MSDIVEWKEENSKNIKKFEFTFDHRTVVERLIKCKDKTAVLDNLGFFSKFIKQLRNHCKEISQILLDKETDINISNFGKLMLYWVCVCQCVCVFCAVFFFIVFVFVYVCVCLSVVCVSLRVLYYTSVTICFVFFSFCFVFLFLFVSY